MDKLLNAIKVLGVSGIVIFFIVAGSYMNKVSVVETKCVGNSRAIKVNSRAISLSIKKSNKALDASERAIKSNEEVAKMAKKLNTTLGNMSVTIAVTSEKVRHNATELQEIKKIVKQIAMRR